MREFHERYLERRAAQGLRTATDRTMEGHQETIAQTLDMLEAAKVIMSDAGEVNQ